MGCTSCGGSSSRRGHVRRSSASIPSRNILCGNCGQNLSATYKSQVSMISSQLIGRGRTLLHIKCPRCHKETVIPTNF